MRFLEVLNKLDRLRPPAPSCKACLRVENLEARLMPYSVSGNAWLPYVQNGTTYNLSSQRLTISFVPDGTLLAVNNGVNVYSNLFATFNAKFGSAATWENEILSAAQLWAQQANLNLTVVADNGTAAGGGKYEQGDPGMGDIRIGGYNFGNTKYLAGTYMPPSANTYSIAGDININTGMSFNINSNYDLQTVMIHEFGHALGLSHSAVSTANMYYSYKTIHRTLDPDDVSGIQAIYGARQADVYGGANYSFDTAADVTSLLNQTTLATVVNNLDLPSTSSAEYFTVTAPAATSGTLTVNVQSAGLSLLRPSVTVYAADQATVLGYAADTGYTGSTLSVPVTGINPGDQFYIVVTGADATQFATGNFALALNFGSGAMPTVCLPNTKVLNATTVVGGGSVGIVGEALTAPRSLLGLTSFTPPWMKYLPPMDFLAISDQYVPLACRMHGPGCSCPACAGAAKMMTQPTPEVRWTLPDWALAGADDSSQHKPTDSASLPPTFEAVAPPGSDAFFANHGVADALPAHTTTPGGGW